MKRHALLLALMTLALVFVANCPCQASVAIGNGVGVSGSLPGGTGVDPTYSFTVDGLYGGADVQITGTLNTTPIGNGEIQAVTSGFGTGTVNGNSVTLSLLSPSAGVYSWGPPVGYYSPTGYFAVDNLLYPNSNQLVDYWGLLFALSETNSSGTELNIYSTGSNSYIYYENSGFNTGVGFGVTESVSFDLTPIAVPEPATVIIWSLLGGLGIVVVHRRKRAA